MLVAVCAFDPVDVVGAGGGGVGGVHFFDIETAVGHLRVAVFAGGAGVGVVAGVAGYATEAFVDTDGGAVVA